jgi:hypothetical protein
VEVVELKRSRIALSDWRPYRQDFRNFEIVWKLTSVSNLPMTILYNYRSENPFLDDISSVAIFSLNFEGQTVPWTLLGTFPFSYFLESGYLP